MKKNICLFLINILAFLLILTSCSHSRNGNNTCYYVDSIPDGDVYSIEKNNSAKEIRLIDEKMEIPAPKESELSLIINNKSILFSYTKPVPGFYGNYSYLYTSDAGEQIRITPNGTITYYYFGKPIYLEGLATKMSEQEIIEIATRFAIGLYGESFTDYYELTVRTNLTEHTMYLWFNMKTDNHDYKYDSHVTIFIDADGVVYRVGTVNVNQLKDTKVPSKFTDEYIEKQCKMFIKDTNTEIEYTSDKYLTVINNDVACLGVNFKAKGSEHSISLLFPIN